MKNTVKPDYNLNIIHNEDTEKYEVWKCNSEGVKIHLFSSFYTFQDACLFIFKWAYKVNPTPVNNKTGKINFKTNICHNCGADKGIHQALTYKCPKNGIEENRYNDINGKYYPQQWEETIFQDSGIFKLHDSAQEIYEALIRAKEVIRIWFGVNFQDQNQENEAWELYNSFAPEMLIINRTIDIFS